MSNKILLIYAVAANPAPLQISMLNSPTAGTLNISLSNPNKVFCKEIEIAIPFGDGADDLFSEFPALSVNNSLWTLVTSTIEHKVLEVGGGAKQYATFNCSCKDPNAYMIDYPLVFCIQGTVNSVLGDATILLRETASASGDPDSWLIGDYSFVETK
ncbi:MAG: hypothetical protein HGA97_09530, partial [Chlorobiaceae bacterium]|nr:hypothetical protein [Chlorobiaceae bacterium]